MAETPRRMSREEMLQANALRIARVCAEAIGDIEQQQPEGKLSVTLDFLQTLLAQRRRIKAYGNVDS